MTHPLPTAAQVNALLLDETVIEETAVHLTTPDPEASPAVQAARLRFTGGEIREVLGAVEQVLTTREASR